MKIVLSAVSAKMGGAANYIKNLARELAALNLEDEFIFFVPEEQARTIRGLSANFHVIATEIGSASFLKRLWFDQVTLRRWLKREKADALYATANFAMLACPCHQVLLVRNVLYFSEIYLTRILPHKSFRAKVENWLRRALIVQSAKWADVVLTPSQAMLDELRRFTTIADEKAQVNRYGVNAALAPVAKEGQTVADPKQKEWSFFFSSLYSEHKNLTTLLRALLLLAADGWRFKLLTPADPMWEDTPLTPIKKTDSELVNDTRLKDRIEFTGVMKSEQIADLYQQADLFVYPSVIESFGHPLVEAMTAGIPVIAADTPINRELCEDAALYFEPFNERDCAAKIRQALSKEAVRSDLMADGLRRSKQFSWSAHLDRLLPVLQRKQLSPTQTQAQLPSTR